MAKQLSIRGVPDEVTRRLTQISQDQGQSVNATVLEILKRAVHVDEKRAYLERYATWTDEDLAEFEKSLAVQRVIDDRLWR